MIGLRESLQGDLLEWSSLTFGSMQTRCSHRTPCGNSANQFTLRWVSTLRAGSSDVTVLHNTVRSLMTHSGIMSPAMSRDFSLGSGTGTAQDSIMGCSTVTSRNLSGRQLATSTTRLSQNLNSHDDTSRHHS